MTGEVRNCRRCGKLYVYVGITICPDCLAKEEEQYVKVKRYLDENPGSSVPDVSAATEVPADVVVDFLRQGLLVAGTGTQEQLYCSVCRRPIQRGRLCAKCEAALGSITGKTGEGVDESDSKRLSRMYTMDSIVKKST